MHKLATVVFFVVISWAAYVSAQTCIIPAPAAPPVPTALVVTIPVDGGTQGCTAHAVVSGTATRQPTEYAVGNAKCAVVVTFALQAAANDNGWSDGGVP